MKHLSTTTSTVEFLKEHFLKNGWCRFPYDSNLAAWAQQALPHAREAVTAPEFSEWMRYGGTWFAGVNALANDAMGRVGSDGSPLRGTAIEFIENVLDLKAGDDFSWDRGQVSVCYPGYPQPMDSETEGAFRYRVKRDAAHVDGLHPVGPKRRRHLIEPHAFVLGIPLTRADATASPLVVWDGSHELIRGALTECYGDLPPDAWADLDVTDVYQSVRKEVFESCTRTVVHASPGECYLVHRLALHGVAPWDNNAEADDDGRMIIYYRPEATAQTKRGPLPWLHAP